jgi:hypothetical protein
MSHEWRHLAYQHLCHNSSHITSPSMSLQQPFNSRSSIISAATVLLINSHVTLTNTSHPLSCHLVNRLITSSAISYHYSCLNSTCAISAAIPPEQPCHIRSHVLPAVMQYWQPCHCQHLRPVRCYVPLANHLAPHPPLCSISKPSCAPSVAMFH